MNFKELNAMLPNPKEHPAVVEADKLYGDMDEKIENIKDRITQFETGIEKLESDLAEKEIKLELGEAKQKDITELKNAIEGLNDGKIKMTKDLKIKEKALVILLNRQEAAYKEAEEHKSGELEGLIKQEIKKQSQPISDALNSMQYILELLRYKISVVKKSHMSVALNHEIGLIETLKKVVKDRFEVQ